MKPGLDRKRLAAICSTESKIEHLSISSVAILEYDPLPRISGALTNRKDTGTPGASPTRTNQFLSRIYDGTATRARGSPLRS